jgi:uncharacterized damage-inducible protein DinB
MSAYWRMFAGYNAWANAQVYECAARLSDADYRADCGAFFKSVHGTLNHLLVTDRIWMRRFTGEGEVAPRLDTILHESLADLRGARIREDERILIFVAGLDAVRLKAPLRYEPVTSRAVIEQELETALAHFFNHQTHHRGQIHGLLTRLTGESPVLDLAVYQRQAGLAQTRSVA